MPHIAVPEGVPGIRSLFMFRPDVAQPMSALADVLLHAPSSLSRGERELIAASVSALNDCGFCHHSHAAVASCHFGDDGTLVNTVVADIARARDEGATDVEIHDTVLIAAAFCMFNRYVDGLGALTPTDSVGYRDRARFVADHGYAAAIERTAVR